MSEDKRPLIHYHPYTNKLVSRAKSALIAAGLKHKAQDLHDKVRMYKPSERGEIIEILEQFVSIQRDYVPVK